MGELTFFLGLQVKQKKDGIFISQDKYVAEILRKFGLFEGKSASTPIDAEKPLLKDLDGEDVDVHTYRSTADQETVNATTVTDAQLQTMIDQGVTAALAARDALRSTNGDDSHNSRTGVRRTERAARECTYTDFLKCQPLPCERMESVFHISNCAAENQVKFATCTLHSVALTWWNTHVQTVGHEAAYDMSWKTLMKMITDKYCPRNEISKLEMELWELKVKGTDLASYTQRFQELALLCGRMFFEESDKVEKYVGGLPDMIHGSVVASKPKTMQEAIKIATELMDKNVRTFTERETASKRKFKNTSRTTRNQQQQHSNKRQNTGRVYTAASGGKKQYGGSRPLCAKCNYHHNGPCAPKCHNCNKIGHSVSDCRSVANTNNANNQRGTGSGQKLGCYECGVQGHFRRECPKLKNNNNHGNQSGRNNAPARVYAIGRAETDPDANVITAAYGMSWKTLMKIMTDKYCPRNEIRKLERELWELKVKGTDLASYTQRFQELALLCGRMFSGESDKVEKYVGGLPDMIHGSVVASKPKNNARGYQNCN
nr:hypothetical protein [Tanacetum cinerariifolium]